MSMTIKVINHKFRREILIPRELERLIPTWCCQIVQLKDKIIFRTSEEYMAILPKTIQYSRSTAVNYVKRNWFSLKYPYRIVLDCPEPANILRQYGVFPLKPSQEFYLTESTYHNKQENKDLPMYVINMPD